MVLPCLMAAFNSIGGSCFGWVGERIKTEAALLIAYGDNIQNLRTQVQDLSDAIESMKDRIKEAENNRGATLVDPVVKTLLERMDSLKEEASNIISDEERASDSTCLMGLRPNLWACYLASKSAKKVLDEADKLLKKVNELDSLVANVDYSQCLGVTPISDFEEFESRVPVSNQIVAALKDPSVNMVGVYGMSGAGKTTLAEKIGVDLQLDRTFSYVVLATVSEKQSLLQNNYQSDLTSIQKQIAGGLKIQLQGENLCVRAEKLRKQLQKTDKVLIILDDIWSKFELEKVGIPVGSSVHTKFKILMTSRSKMVLENDMDSTNNFGLDSLPPNDARNLFDKMVGGDAQYSNWPLTAQQVVDHCGGIPILLVTIGRALKNRNSKTWEDALTQLKQFDGEDIVNEAYKRIEVSYKFLNSEMKKLLLLCTQLDHRSIPMEDLLKYAMGLDLFKRCKRVKEVSDRLHKYLDDLKGCCLLQDGNEKEIIKMHDVVHKFASFVAFRDHHVFTVADGELQEWPSKDELEHFSAISLPYCHLPPYHMLPAAFDNPKLESFLMLRSWIDASFKIPDNFFAGMKGLKLMNLTRMSLSPALVSSLSALVKIRTLCLDHCKLGDIAVIGELPMLQALSLIGSSIVWVPKEIGKLGNTLKLLDLRNCDELETIASGVISRLTLLEDLRIGDSFMTWERLEGSDKSNNSADETYEAEMASLKEFKNLPNLINLEIHILEHAKMFPKGLVFKKLETFRIFIGSGSRLFRGEYLLPRILVVNEFSTVVEFDNEGTKALMTRAESLRLIGVKSSVSVSEMDPKGFPELKHLNVKDTYGHLNVEIGGGIQYIVKKNYNNCIFPKLETLDLYHLDKLERICDDHDHPRPVRSFENLRVINVSYCNLLNDLLSSNLARGLLCLKEITIRSCESMESIIVSRESENEEEIKIGFTHQLRALTLRKLPRLLSFYRFKQLEGLPSPTPLFNKKIVFPKLEELVLSWMKIEKIWDDHLAIAAEGTCWFQNLTSLKVCGCENLSYMFTFSMVKSFAQLKNLEIEHCESIEEIVVTRKGEMEGERLLLFPKLEYLVLDHLPKLKFFCHANLLECRSLQKLEIYNCPLLNAFIGTNDSTPDLGANSTTLFDEKVAFRNIEKLEIDGCDSITSIFPTSLVPTLQQLEWLRVRDCASLDFFGFNNTQQLNDAFAKVFSSLKYCDLESGGIIVRYEHDTFLDMWELEIDGCNDIICSPKLFALLKSFPKLDRVEVSSCSIIFPCEPDHLAADDGDDMDTQAKTLARIQHLKLTNLDNMKHIWSEHSPLNYHGIPRDPKVLEVVDCDSLLSLAPPSTTLFKNLTGLVVSRCPMLTKLVASSSTAKSLVNLKEMSVTECDSLEEIVVIDDQWDELASNDEYIVFEKLEVLELQDLNSLTSFCSTSNCNFRFPSLNRVIVKNCPRMKFFSKGALSTPKLIRVWPFWVIEKDEERQEKLARWDGDLNSTIRQLFEKMGQGLGLDKDEDNEEGEAEKEMSITRIIMNEMRMMKEMRMKMRIMKEMLTTIKMDVDKDEDEDNEGNEDEDEDNEEGETEKEEE